MRIGAIIQARSGSERFPGKVLLEMPFKSEVSVLGRIVERIRSVQTVDAICIATSNEGGDDSIARESDKLGTLLYRGSLENVLDRFVGAAKAHQLDVVIRLTGDNPVVFSDILERVLAHHIASGADYTRNNGLPLGASFEIVNVEVLHRILQSDPTQSELEHVTLYVKNHRDQFKIEEVDHDLPAALRQLRLTMDYPADYAMLNLLLSGLSDMKHYGIEDLAAAVAAIPWLTEINQGLHQRQQ